MAEGFRQATAGFRQAQKNAFSSRARISKFATQNFVFACICKFVKKNLVFARICKFAGKKEFSAIALDFAETIFCLTLD